MPGRSELLEWRRASVAQMKAQFDRAKLSPDAQANYDIWALELDRAELTYKFRRYQPPFYSFLYSVHSELPNFLINTHVCRTQPTCGPTTRACGPSRPVLDAAIAESGKSDAAGIHAPQVPDRAGDLRQPGDRHRRALRRRPGLAPVGGRQGQGRQAAGRRARSRLRRPRPCLPRRAPRAGLKPAYGRVIAWARASCRRRPAAAWARSPCRTAPPGTPRR